jgi:hypothetical protein
MPLGRPFQRVTNYPSGRKEIVMFFYLYAIIELLAFLLDSNIIPTANVTYPVNIWNTSIFFEPVTDCFWGAVVVRRLIYRLGRRRILLPSRQWFCWLPVRRGRHTVIALGAPSPIPGYLIALNGCSFYESLVSQRLAPRSSLLLRHSRVMWVSLTASLWRYGLSTSSGRSPARSYMSYRN